jgi:hypothetical protein
MMLANESLTHCYAFRPDVVATVLEDGAVLLDLETKYFYRVNRTGWVIVQLFESGTTLQNVYASCHAHGSPASDKGAIAAVIEALIHDNLIQTSSNPTQALTSALSSTLPWSAPTIEKQAEPLQRVIISAFDPSVPLVE